MFRITALLLVVVLNCTGALGQSACQTKRLNAVKSGQSKARGSNLGNWLILESWMSSKLWTDNGCNKTTQGGTYLLEQCLGSKAQAVMQKHWSSFITEDDFAQMSKHGVNLVRIPVGWWQIYDLEGGAAKAKLNQNISPRNYITGGLAVLDKAFDWGKKYGIAILVCMHAPPGSQNGNDHSSPTQYPGQINWDKYPENVAQTIDSLSLYAQRYNNHDALFGFSLLNEPAKIKINILQDYYKKAYAEIRKYTKSCYIVINPLINPFQFGTESDWTGFMNPAQGYTNVAMDLHYYSCFGGPGDQSNADGAINYIKYDRLQQVKDYIKANPKPMLVGEWSATANFSNTRAGDFMKAQVDVYNQAKLGWTFWSWTDGSPGNTWSLQTAFNSGWISDISGNVC